MFILHGENNKKQWTIEGRVAVDKRFYAIVTVGGKKRLTDFTYKTEQGAKDAGCYLLAKILAEVPNAP